MGRHSPTFPPNHAQRLHPFPLRSVPLARNSTALQTAKTLRPPSEDAPRRLNRFAELRRFKLPEGPTSPPGTNPARRSAVHDFCGTPPAVFRVRLLGSLSSEERLSRSLRSVFKVRSLPRGLGEPPSPLSSMPAFARARSQFRLAKKPVALAERQRGNSFPPGLALPLPSLLSQSRCRDLRTSLLAANERADTVSRLALP